MYRANLDHWEYGIDIGQEVLAPTWEQLKALILELDEDKQTLVTYGDEEAGDYMAVGGRERTVHLLPVLRRRGKDIYTCR